jgi:Tol biopolymer transport system component
VSASDPIVAVLRRLDRPVQPRPEFADSLLARLLSELPDGAAPVGGPARLRLPRILPRVSPRLRLALIVIALLLLLVAIATAAYLGVKAWVAVEPRGVQVTSDYQLTRVFRDTSARPGLWSGFVVGSGGKDLYAWRHDPDSERRADPVRLLGVDSARRPVEAERVLSLESLSQQPALWDPGTRLTNTLIARYAGAHLEEGNQVDTLAAAENGDLFLVVGVWRERDEFHWRVPPVSASVVVRHGDGSLEKVLTLRELVREALPGASPENVEVEIAASQPRRLWLKVRAGEPTSRSAGLGKYSVVEVVDPDGDGRWDDRALRRLALPDSIPTADFDRRGFQRTAITEIEAEPGSRAFVLTAVARAGPKGRFRIFRVEDRNGDGDANEEGEVSVVLDRSGVSTGADFGPTPSVSVRPEADGGLVAARLTRPTRITLVSPSGEQTDVGRSFEGLGDVLAGTGGDIYVIRQIPGGARTSPSWIGYRLTPIEGERNATPATPPETAVRPTSRSRGVPRIAFILLSADWERGRIVTVRADGRGGVSPLVPGRFNQGFCQSANGERVGYLSDAEAPHEPFIYVADADGSSGRKVSEHAVGFQCGFSERWLLLTRETNAAMTLIRHDLRTGAETRLVRNVDQLALSPGGNTILFVGGLDFGDSPRQTGKETLELLNMNTLERRRLAGPPTRGGYSALTWSPDGRRIAYMIKAAPRRRVLEVRDTRSGALALRLRMSGGRPTIRWSPDSTRLLVCVPARGSLRGCSEGLPQARPSARLMIVDVPTGRRQLAVRGELLWADWSPTGGYGYATPRAVFAVTAAGRTRRLAAAPQRTRAGSWLGFSPDGRYIGLGDFSTRLAVVDVKTGKLRILMREHKGGGYIMNRTWWR